MNALLKLCALAGFAIAALAGCQHTASDRLPPAPVDPKPPAIQYPGASATPAAAVQAPPRQQATTVITLHLAQEQAEAPLLQVDVGGASLYALPQPILTQADLGRVSPVVDQGQGNFILLEMNQHGIPKLHRVTEQAQGHYLLLSVQGQLVSVARIGQTIKDGRLLVGTQNPQHTQAIIKMMWGG